VNKYAYPGKSAEDIEAELRTIKVNSTPSHIIIHAGTNNIPTDSAEVCVKKIESLVLKTKFPDSKIGVSGITMRQDIEVGQNIKQSTKN
jgi:sialic acid synthase SpsE